MATAPPRNAVVLVSGSSRQKQQQQSNVTSSCARISLPAASPKGLLLLAPNFCVASPALAFQAKQAELLVEKLVTTLTTQKVLDKITTVITGQTTIEPESLIKVISEEPDDAWEALKSNFFDLWTTSINSAASFDPAAFAQTSWELLADFAERFATWELSSLVALGERWLIWTPLVILPMAWQMNEQQQQQKKRIAAEDNRQEALQLSEAAARKQEQVYLELRRIELRTALLAAVEQVANKEKVESLARELAELPSSSAAGQESTVERGTWRLIYATLIRELPQVPGFEITNLAQRLLVQSLQNSATIRLGPLGAVQVTLGGTQDSATSSVSMTAFEARLVELLGTPITVQLPALNLEVPEALRQTTQWKLLYADEDMRINEGTGSRLYLFLRSD